LRLALGFRVQKKFCLALGVEQTLLSRWETGQQDVPARWLNRMAAMAMKAGLHATARELLSLAEFDKDAFDAVRLPPARDARGPLDVTVHLDADGQVVGVECRPGELKGAKSMRPAPCEDDAGETYNYGG
jgi:transcriptional regulator with XRE-family HTH domain